LFIFVFIWVFLFRMLRGQGSQIVGTTRRVFIAHRLWTLPKPTSRSAITFRFIRMSGMPFEVVETPQLFYFVYGAINVHVIPKRVFHDASELTRFSDLLKHLIGDRQSASTAFRVSCRCENSPPSGQANHG